MGRRRKKEPPVKPVRKRTRLHLQAGETLRIGDIDITAMFPATLLIDHEGEITSQAGAR